MKNQSYSVCLDDKYYHEFISLYNSWKYYEHTTPIKIYIVGEIDDSRLNNLKDKFEVIDLRSFFTKNPRKLKKYLYKWVSMLEYSNDYEILLDADTIFLSNTEHMFSYLKEGKLVLCNEHFDIEHKFYQYKEKWKYEHNRIQNELRKYLGNYANRFTSELKTPNYNAGFFGINKKKHSYLLEKCIEILISDFDTSPNPMTQTEQYMMNVLIQLYNEDKMVLPQIEWMNTWEYHKNPKKMIKIEDGKFKVIDEKGNHIKFYHFTGDIGVLHLNSKMLKPCRMYNLVEPKFFSPKEVEKLWYNRHQSPVILLWEYFYNKGLS